MVSLCKTAAVVCLLTALPAAGLASLRMEASASWAENINRASSPADWRDAMTYETRAAYGLLREWRTGLLTTGEAGAGVEHVPSFQKLDVTSLNFAGTVRQKFGLGAFAPAVAVDLGLRGRSARMAGADGWTASGALRLGKRITEAWRVGVTGDWQQHYAQSDVFDTKHHRFFATVTWDISDRWQLSHGNGRLWGSFTANASPTVWPRALGGAFGSAISEYYNAVPWAVTDSFGPGWVTYIVDGRVSFWWLELSPALGRNTSLPLRYESLFAVNKVGVKYRQDVWTLSLIHRF